LVDRVIAGEYTIALQIFAHHPLISAGKGAPVTSRLLPPVASAPGTLVIPKGSRHPHAAALLMDFLLSKEGQQILAAAEYLSVRAIALSSPQARRRLVTNSGAPIADSSGHAMRPFHFSSSRS
jgi:ABC-type Fe3+ transport system substrate-binding protein